ncbi:hypothetical protein [Aquimarina sp. MMG016]|uniref:phage baseplate protein n=1 Tax=Aquimarina sp. MMG016 TaxID=2822690 RepID=UPI001B39FD21|nr:hypothetical protein [Aquimarina sp. MMG016]MBQ4820694.1 hypothetical protein [Aquimarina sp. MMG016]
MDINKRNRTELKQFFEQGDQPTEQQFGELIDAGMNQAEDGIAKIQGNPLAIQAEGESIGTQEVLDLFTSFNDDNPQWSLNLNPRVDIQEPSSSQSGLNIKDATGQSRLFIRSGQGNVGIGTLDPVSKVTIEGKNNPSLLSVIDTSQERTKILEVTKKEGVTIKGALQVDGDFMANNISSNVTLGSEGASDTRIATQKAVKTYIDTRLPKGLISMWSGKDIPSGWALCNGKDNTPDLSGKFIVGFDKDTNDYNEIGKTGGLEEVRLTEAELPPHTHTDKGHVHSITDPGHNHINSSFNRLVRQTGNDTHKGTDGRNDPGKEFDLRNSAEIKESKTGIKIISGKSNLEKTGGDQPHENRPPYYVLAYIMKL